MKAIKTNNIYYRALSEKITSFISSGEYYELALYAEIEKNAWRYFFVFKENKKSDYVFSERTPESYSNICASNYPEKCRELEDALDDIRKSYIKSGGHPFSVFEFKVTGGEVCASFFAEAADIIDYSGRLDLWKFRVTGIGNSFSQRFNKHNIITDDPYLIELINGVSAFIPEEWYELALYVERSENTWKYLFCARETKKSDYVFSDELSEGFPDVSRSRDNEKTAALLRSLDTILSAYEKRRSKGFVSMELYVLKKVPTVSYSEIPENKIGFLRRSSLWAYRVTRQIREQEADFVQLYIRQHKEEFSRKAYNDDVGGFLDEMGGIVEWYRGLDPRTEKITRMLIIILIALIIALFTGRDITDFSFWIF